MSSLREVKDRIASVRSTLKITSAMKLVASSKLRKAQRTIEALRPYEATLESILAAVSGTPDSAADAGTNAAGAGTNAAGAVAAAGAGTNAAGSVAAAGAGMGRQPVTPILRAAAPYQHRQTEKVPPLVILAFSSNSSMCGAFNANAIKKVQEVICQASSDSQELELWAFGKKMQEFLRKNGTPASRDFTTLIAHPEYAAVAQAAAELRSRFEAGTISGVLLVYNHFVTTGHQQVVVEPYLGCGQLSDTQSSANSTEEEFEAGGQGFIMEPSRTELLASLMPQVMDLKLYAALLDSVAAEHAARMVAMQAATDNGEALLAELTLEYNKGRQQKITSEILDLVAGSAV